MTSRFLLIAVLLAGTARGADVPKVPRIASVRVHPTTIEIRHHRQPHSVLVLGTTEDGYDLDLLEQAKLTVDDSRVAAVADLA